MQLLSIFTHQLKISKTVALDYKHFSSVCCRSMIFRKKRAESDNSLVSEGLREAITSYLQMTEGHDHSWDT